MTRLARRAVACGLCCVCHPAPSLATRTRPSAEHARAAVAARALLRACVAARVLMLACVLANVCRQVRLAKSKIDNVLERAREELPPLPPPLTSGWRPVPNVGDSTSAEYVDGSSGKRPREDDAYGEYSQRAPPPPPGQGRVDNYSTTDRPTSGAGGYGPNNTNKVGNCFDFQRGICSRGDNCARAPPRPRSSHLTHAPASRVTWGHALTSSSRPRLTSV